MKSIPTILAAVLLAAGAFYLGSWYSQRASGPNANPAARQILHYVCPMHPQYTSDRPGDAPCCGMRLEPVYADGQAAGGEGGGVPLPPGSVQVSPEKQQILGVRTAAVEKTPAAHTLRTLGRVTPDERLVYSVNAALNAWVRETYADTTGSVVKKDDRLATLYSPTYRNALQAYLTGLAHLDSAQKHLESPAQIAAVERSVELYRDGLRNLGMGEPQIEEIRRTRQQTEDIHVYAPATGFVLARNVSAGQRILNGEELYKIADLNRIWILADLFEHESRYVRPGQIVRVLYQGRTFRAEVSDVLPQFDAATRTLKVRLEMDNPEYVLRPDMFVDVEFPINLPPALTVPVDAVIDAGVKKTVFVAQGDGRFEPRIVETGWRFGDRVEIVKGLMPGEDIVVSGNFLLDSESRMKLAAAAFRGVESQKDPVCGMDVDPGKAAGKSEYRGKTYYFCAIQCKQKFDKNPEAFVEKKALSHKDPVCGMDVDPGKAAGKSEYQGKTYYFCSEHCKRQFDRNPERYVAKKT